MIDGLVVIRRLDEGVDMPGCAMAFFLASSREPRQFIQRHGCVLRQAPGKLHAEKYDFRVATPNSEKTHENERRLLASEFGRFQEFADLAINNVECRSAVSELERRLELTHLL